MLFDSHCHLTDDRLRTDVDAVVALAREHGVTGMVTIGADLDDWDGALEIARHYDDVSAALGIHPHIADRADDAAFDRLTDLARRGEIVALGETGLDFYYDNAPRAAQHRAFLRHLELGAKLDMPIVVHTRAADEDTVAVLREAGHNVRGVLHCFAGGRALLETALEIGWYISFSGLVTFKNYDDHDLVRLVPADRLLVETDSPYLAPVPRRGKRNEPAFVRHVAEAIASIRGEDFETLARRTAENACTFYRL